MKEQLHFSTILTILPLVKKLKRVPKCDVLKFHNQGIPAQRKEKVNLFSSPIKVEANIPITRQYQKLLTNRKCGMKKGTW